MIAAVREWLTAVVASSLLLSVVQTLVPEGRLRRTASFTGGLVLTVILLRPLLGADLRGLEVRMEDYREAIEARQAELEAAGDQQLRAIIETRTAAYISDKAAALGLTLQVQVEARPGEEGIPIPWEAELTGGRSEALAAWMEGELGIPRERQVWHDEEH